MAHLLIGSRAAKLALSQANWVKTQLEKLHPGLLVGLEIIELAEAEATPQDAFQSAAEEALQTRRVDGVLHSLRELPLDLPLEFHLAAITERAEPREALVVRDDWHAQVKRLFDLPDGARIGVNTFVRRAQLQALLYGWQIVDLYAPLETRLKQLDLGEVDALVVAAAALLHLGERGRIAALLEPNEVLPAAGQGAFALQTRLEDQRTNLLLEALNHWPTRYATAAERAVLRNLLPQPFNERRAPAAALARVEESADGPQLIVTATVADADGSRLVRSEGRGPLRQGELIGSALAHDLLNNGARELLQASPMNLYAAVEELFPVLQESAVALAASAPLMETRGAEVAQAEEQTAAVSAFVSEAAHEFDLVATKARKAREQAPLKERRILIARATRANAELVNGLEELGAEVVVCPTVRTSEPTGWESLDKALLHLSWYDWVTFVSAASVTYFFKRFLALGHHLSEIEARRISAVGARTAEALRAEGVQPDLVLERFTAECLAEAVRKRYGVRERLRGTSMLLLASQTSHKDLRSALDKFGVYVEVGEAYRTSLPETGSAEIAAELRAAHFHYVLFNGESSVENLATVLEPSPLPVFLGAARVLCTNDGAREAAQAHSLQVHLQPNEVNVAALVRALQEDCLQQEFAWG
ncbi:MAG: uroporphyrinogen-III synthase [Acidobacteria bacterium]|nr:uroporphyrinogen-III synthase [Acidobacteriota bacterium]MBI3425896.1 uroporphyrinogen-III synthase [Acidobacteriota bacterium]